MRRKKDGVRQSRFPISLFWIILAALLVTAGVNQGLVIGLAVAAWPSIVQVHIIILYWIGVSAGLAYLVMRTIRRVYDEPLREISDATKRIAKGDFSVRVTPTHTGDQIDYLDVMTSDINTMAEELGSIETLKTDFISNVSHEIKTPLAAVRNFGRLLQAEGLTDEERAEYARSVTEAASRLNALITNILRLNRLENQQILPQSQRFDLSAQLGECMLQFEDVWEEKSIALEVDVPDGVMVASDGELLSLVWNNLLSNAFKFTEEGGTVAVALREEAGSAVVTVSDTGCGMSEETRRHAFDKFYQGDTSRATQGNGLGLALVRRVLDLLGGEISVSSAPGEGSAFTVRLPQ